MLLPYPTLLRSLAMALLLALIPPTGSSAWAQGATDGPFSLTDPDGQGLILETLAIRSAVHGMLSMTEYELTFVNPQDRQIEGRFKAIIPQGATLSRLAKDVNGVLVEGEVVERLRAQQIYQEILHTMRDPALLEQDQGNRYQLKIFPIEARGRTRILLSYTQLLPIKDGRRVLHIPIEGLPEIGNFSFEGIFSPLPGERYAGDDVSLHAQNFRPTESLKFGFISDSKTPATSALRSGDFVLISHRPDLPKGTDIPRERMVFYIDTSASSAGMLTRRGKGIAAILRGLPKGQPVDIRAYDQEVVPLLTGTAHRVSAQIEAHLDTRGYLGATDLSRLLEDIVSLGEAHPTDHVVLIGDGIPTLGPRDAADLIPLLDPLPSTLRVDAIPLGSRYDGDMLKDLTAAGNGRVLPLSLGSSMEGALPSIVDGLRTPPGVTVDIESEGHEWVYPTQFEDVQPGDELLFLAKVPPGDSLELYHQHSPLAFDAPRPIDERFSPLLEREAWAAYLGHLEMRRQSETDPAIAQAIAKERIRISETHRVMIPQTTLLVLESEEDYKRYGLTRRGLSDILTLGPQGVERLKRAAPQLPAPVLIAPKTSEWPPADAQRERNKGVDFDLEEPLEKKRDHRLGQSPGGGGGMEDGVAGPLNTTLSTLSANNLDEEALEGLNMAEARSSSMERPRRARSPSSSIAPPREANQMPLEDAAVEGEFKAVEEERAQGSSHSVMEFFRRGDIQITDERAPSDPSAPEPNPVLRRPSPRPQPKPTAIDWVKAGQLIPTQEEIKGLLSAIARDPLNRIHRLRLSDALIKAEAWTALRDASLSWQRFDSGNPKIYESLMFAYHNLGEAQAAHRAAGALIDLAPSTPEALVHAAYIWMYCGGDHRLPGLLEVAIDLRPDYPNTYRALGLIYELENQPQRAAEALERALGESFESWYGDVKRIIREELSYQYQSLLADGADATQIDARRRRHQVTLSPAQPLRITLTWNTDANDVDLHAVGPDGAECSYQNMLTPSLHLYQDITQGFGPEVMVAETSQKGTYHIGVNYFSAGPMGVSRGVVVVRTQGRIERILPFGLVPQGDDMAYLMSLTL